MEYTDTGEPEWLDPEMALDASRLLYPQTNERVRKLAIIGAARQGELLALPERLWARFEFDSPGRDAVDLTWPDPFYEADYVGLSAFTYQLAHSHEFWINGATLEQRVPYIPRELDGKWPRHFSDCDLDRVGALVWGATGVKFHAAQFFALLQDQQWKARGDVLTGQGSVKTGRGKPINPKWRVAIAEIVADAATQSRYLTWAKSEADVTEYLLAELESSFNRPVLNFAKPKRRELLEWVEPMTNAILQRRRFRRNYRHLIAPGSPKG